MLGPVSTCKGGVITRYCFSHCSLSLSRSTPLQCVCQTRSIQAGIPPAVHVNTPRLTDILRKTSSSYGGQVWMRCNAQEMGHKNSLIDPRTTVNWFISSFSSWDTVTNLDHVWKTGWSEWACSAKGHHKKAVQLNESSVKSSYRRVLRAVSVQRAWLHSRNMCCTSYDSHSLPISHLIQVNNHLRSGSNVCFKLPSPRHSGTGRVARCW